MNWVPLNSKQIRAASYDPETQLLHVKVAGGRSVRHIGVLPHIYDNLVETDDPEFYYKYYLEPSRVPPRWWQKAGTGARTVKLLIAFIAVVVVTTTALEESGELPIHLSEITESVTGGTPAAVESPGVSAQ